MTGKKEEPTPAGVKRKAAELTKDKINELISKANKKFGSDFKLIGSWKTKGYSNHDIDVFTEKEKNVDETGLWLAKQTGLTIDVFYPGSGLLYNYQINPDGSAGYWFEEVEKQIIEDLEVKK